MILSFKLSMPNCGSWDGKWSGDGKNYVITRSFTGKKNIENAEKILEKRYYYYSWGDGWGAGILVNEVDSSKAKKLRKDSNGFCGYDWMVDSIIKYGQPLASHQIEEFIK